MVYRDDDQMYTGNENYTADQVEKENVYID